MILRITKKAFFKTTDSTPSSILTITKKPIQSNPFQDIQNDNTFLKKLYKKHNFDLNEGPKKEEFDRLLKSDQERLRSIFFKREIEVLKNQAKEKKNFSEQDRKRLIDLAHKYGDPNESINSRLFEFVSKYNIFDATKRKVDNFLKKPGIKQAYKKSMEEWMNANKDKNGIAPIDVPFAKKIEFALKEGAFSMGRAIKGVGKTIAGSVAGKFAEMPGVGDMVEGLANKVGIELPEIYNDKLLLPDGNLNREAFKKWPLSHSLGMLGDAWVVSPALTLGKMGAVTALTTFLIALIPPVGLVVFTVITVMGAESTVMGTIAMGEKTFLAIANIALHGLNRKDNSIQSLQDVVVNLAPFIGSLTKDDNELREMIQKNNPKLSKDEVNEVLSDTQRIQNEITQLMQKAETLGLVKKKDDDFNNPLDDTKKNPFADPVDDKEPSFLKKFQDNNVHTRDGPKM